MKNRFEQIASTLTGGGYIHHGVFRRLAGGVMAAILVAVGLGTFENRSARAQSLQADLKAYNAVAAVLELCTVTVVPFKDLDAFWVNVGFGTYASADDVCTCWSRSVNISKVTEHCDQDAAYDACMIWSGSAPLGRPVTNYPGTFHQNPVEGCFY